MPKCYSYIRFSRPEQMRGDILRRQMEAADKWAAEHGMVIDESLTDLGLSGFRGLNWLKGNLGKFLDLVEKRQVPKGSFLIIESLDRFSRKDALDVIGELAKLLTAGITIVTPRVATSAMPADDRGISPSGPSAAAALDGDMPASPPVPGASTDTPSAPDIVGRSVG